MKGFINMYQTMYKLNETKDKVITYVVQPYGMRGLEKLAINSIKKCPKLYTEIIRRTTYSSSFSTKSWSDKIEFLNDKVFFNEYSNKTYVGQDFDQVSGNYAGNGCDHFYEQRYYYEYNCYQLEKHFEALLNICNFADEIHNYGLSYKNLLKCMEYARIALTFTDEEITNLGLDYFDYFYKCCDLVFKVYQYDIDNFENLEDLFNIFIKSRYYWLTKDEIIAQELKYYNLEKQWFEKYIKERKITNIEEYLKSIENDNWYRYSFFKSFLLTNHWLSILGDEQKDKVEIIRKRAIILNKK